MNFNDLYKKISAIDSAQVLKEDGHARIEECGEMPGMMNMPHGMPGMPQPQQDSVSMNVSMNASGKGGIRDLMNVLRNIEDSVEQHGGDHGPIELPGDGEIEIDGPAHEIEIDKGPFDDEHSDIEVDEPEHDLAIIDAGEEEGPTADKPAISPEQKMKAAVAASVVDDDDVDENFANRPNVTHQGINYMTTANAGGPNKPHQEITRMGQPTGNNPMKESLISQLQQLYQEVKGR